MNPEDMTQHDRVPVKGSSRTPAAGRKQHPGTGAKTIPDNTGAHEEQWVSPGAGATGNDGPIMLTNIIEEGPENALAADAMTEERSVEAWGDAVSVPLEVETGRKKEDTGPGEGLQQASDEAGPGTHKQGVDLPDAEEGDPLLDTMGLDMSEQEYEASHAAERLEIDEQQVGADPGIGVEAQGRGAIMEKISEAKVEEIVTRIVKQRVDEKVERILLDAAEAAVSREIEKLKKDL